MRVLVEIVHPADVLFYLRPIRIFEARGDAVTVASRRKDVACDLLDAFGIEHTPLSTAGTGMAALGRELALRDLALLRLVRRERPQVMLGFGGVAVSQVGWWTGVPSVVHYDSDNAVLQNRLAWPFVTRLSVPEDYAGPTPAGRTARLAGCKELSRFHPDGFRPDRARALAQGLDPERPNLFLRLVSWRANHDAGKRGWTPDQAGALVAALAPLARLHVSAEGAVPPALAPHLWRGDPAEVHHLLAFCDAYAGESVTMAAEAMVLGVPALYAGVDFPGVARGLARRGLMTLLEPPEHHRLPEATAALLGPRAAFEAAREDWLAGCPDWALDVVAKADAHARAPW